MSNDQPSSSQIDNLGSIVHDLKTPLASINSYADLIEHSGELNDRQQRYLERIYAAVQNMSNLVNEILDLAWIEGDMILRKKPCNLLDIVKSEMHALEGIAKDQSISLQLSYGEDLVLVNGDERRLRQVINNILSNSIKYSDSASNVSIQISRIDNTLLTTVTDHGMGIAPEELPHIFDRFYRSSRQEASKIEGSGLGLYIARAIIERHGGTISAESVLEQGTTIKFTIPIS